MIERILFAKLSDPQQRHPLASRVAAALSAVPDVLEARVGLPADDASRKSWDLSVVLVCRDDRALARALANEAVVRCLEELIEAHSECVKAWSFRRV